MTTNFDPFQAAELANDVYLLSSQATLKGATELLQEKYGDAFSFPLDTMLKGKTGGPGIVKVETAFGFMLLGKGVWKGHAVILFRGTSYLADWITNFNISTVRSSNGAAVHAGFQLAFNSMAPQIRNFVGLAKKNNVHTFHCVGHSLGGAIATICAEWLYVNYKHHPYLYTFGSPRVGLEGFSASCTRHLGNRAIFRTYHKTDIVPCIPIWPFIHTPNKGVDYYIPSPGIMPGASYHSMSRYVSSVMEIGDWELLARLRPVEASESDIKTWLRADSPVGLTITTIEFLNKALIWVLGKCVGAAIYIIANTVGTGFTLMDQLAIILKKGLNLADSVSQWVLRLMSKIMRVLGLKRIADTADMTHEFIRSVLMQLQNRLNSNAKNVLNEVLAKGRAA